MATATRKTDVAGRRVAKKGEPRLARYAEKEVTPVISDFADWLETEVFGRSLDENERLVLFVGSALRGTFQKSPENQARIAQRKEEIETEIAARAERAKEREQRRAAKESAPKVAKAAKPTGKAATKSAPAKSATKSAPAAKSGAGNRRRPAGKSNADF